MTTTFHGYRLTREQQERLVKFALDNLLNMPALLNGQSNGAAAPHVPRKYRKRQRRQLTAAEKAEISKKMKAAWAKRRANGTAGRKKKTKVDTATV